MAVNIKVVLLAPEYRHGDMFHQSFKMKFSIKNSTKYFTGPASQSHENPHFVCS